LYSPSIPKENRTETPDETIWRGRYGNCDHGYFVNLPPGVIGHGSRSPSPNHGFVISAKDPSTTTPVTLEEPRLVDVYESSDAAHDVGGCSHEVSAAQKKRWAKVKKK